MKKNFTAIALAVAGMTAQDAFATIATTAIAAGSQLQIGCTAPSAGGATVYSIDNSANNTGVGVDFMALPTGVAAGASCAYAINQLIAAQSLTSTTTGRWVGVGATSGATGTTGISPVNVTIPGSGYSLQAYTFVAQ